MYNRVYHEWHKNVRTTLWTRRMLDVLVGLGKVRYLNHHSAEIFQPSVLNKTVAIKCQCALPIMMFVSLLSKKRNYWPWPLKWLNGRRWWWWCGQGVISQSWLSRSSGSCVTFVMSRWLATLPRLTRGAAKELDCRGIVRLNREWGGVGRGGRLPCYNFVPELYLLLTLL